ncbi:MAG: hypothetical protein IPL78_21415 [Chloroflexi bacterium]|nr:hypothetical protein [Chloroflexota bacterium]
MCDANNAYPRLFIAFMVMVIFWLISLTDLTFIREQWVALLFSFSCCNVFLPGIRLRCGWRCGPVNTRRRVVRWIR